MMPCAMRAKRGAAGGNAWKGYCLRYGESFSKLSPSVARSNNSRLGSGFATTQSTL